jgi:hypothetical protein
MATQQQAFQQQLLTTQEKFMADHQQFRMEQRQINAKHEQAIQRLDVTVGQLAKEMMSESKLSFQPRPYLIQEVTNKCRLSRFSEVAR